MGLLVATKLVAERPTDRKARGFDHPKALHAVWCPLRGVRKCFVVALAGVRTPRSLRWLDRLRSLVISAYAQFVHEQVPLLHIRQRINTLFTRTAPDAAKSGALLQTHANLHYVVAQDFVFRCVRIRHHLEVLEAEAVNFLARVL